MGKFNFKDEQDFEKVRSEAEALYADIGAVRCPYLREEIAFNAKGIRHLKFKNDRQARPREDQYTRLKLIRYAPEVLKLSHTLKGVWMTKRFEPANTHGQWKHEMRDVTFYEFFAVLDLVRVRVIVKQVLGGEKHFYSVIPFWGIDKNTSTRILHSGNPEHD